MPTNLWLDFLGIRLDSKKAEGLKFTVNLITPDNGEKYVVELNNSTLTNIKGFQAPKPDLTITINRTDLEAVMMGAATLDQQITSGKAKLVGDRRPYNAIVFTHQQKLFSFFVLLSIIAIIILIK
jgi:alkyl sulfatase BDS1-like metallo-beta-lactamase superfamily hydrolase